MQMKLPNLSHLMDVGELRYIQSIHERTGHQNPDSMVQMFLPLFDQIRCKVLSKRKLAKLRLKPFYYYLIARTRYYDQIFLIAINDNVKYIINIGCGSDTRPYRFKDALKKKNIQVVECDQIKLISAKQKLARLHGSFGNILYMAIDLNRNTWTVLENWIQENSKSKVFVLIEGVSQYIKEETFQRFLSFLGKKLSSGSRVAYDFKICGVADDFGMIGRTQKTFRLPEKMREVTTFHAERNFKLEHMEYSSKLSVQFLPKRGTLCDTVFGEDVLVQLMVNHLPIKRV